MTAFFSPAKSGRLIWGAGPIGVSALFYLAMEAERLGADPTVLAAGTLGSTEILLRSRAAGLPLGSRRGAEAQRRVVAEKRAWRVSCLRVSF